jgi:hypothetical protein
MVATCQIRLKCGGFVSFTPSQLIDSHTCTQSRDAWTPRAASQLTDSQFLEASISVLHSFKGSNFILFLILLYFSRSLHRMKILYFHDSFYSVLC